MAEAHILETTVRDGSYAVNFHFTVEDSVIIAATLDRAGFEYIEIGHGGGLGFSDAGRAPAVKQFFGRDISSPASDEHYMRAVRRNVHRAKLGVPFAPNFPFHPLAMESIALARDCGLDFLRILVPPSEVGSERTREAVRLGRDLGFTVAVNFMKSDLETPETLADKAALAHDLGAQWIYVVDSTGCMTPVETAGYVEAIRKRVDVQVGFHGHDNTAMAVMNSLAAIDAGATLIDATLQGLGRSLGNAATETLLVLLQTRKKLESHIDRRLVFALARGFIRPFVRQGFDPAHVLAGAGKVHSERLRKIQEIAATHGLGLEDVVFEVGEEAQKRQRRLIPDELVHTVCESVPKPSKQQRKEFLRSLAADLTRESPPLVTLDDVLALQRVSARRDRLRPILVLARGSLWSFRKPIFVTRGSWAIAAVPGEAVDLRELSRAGDLDRIYVDEPFDISNLSALGDRIETFSLVHCLAEAATVQQREGHAFVACDDAELDRAIRSRLWRSRVVAESEPGATSAGPPITELYVEGRRGMQALEAFVPSRLESGGTLTVLGPERLPREIVDVLRSRNIEIRIPDVFTLLGARALVRDRAVIRSTSEPTRDADLIAYEISPQDGIVVDLSRGALVDGWEPCAGLRQDNSPDATKQTRERLLEGRLAQILDRSVEADE